MRKRRDPNSYEIGYCKPPKATQFRKGQSGNPQGRRSAPKTPQQVLKKTLNRTMSVRQDGRVTRMSVLEVIVNTLAHQAMKGDIRAFAQLMRMMQESSLDGPAPGQHGVLVVPGRLTQEEYAEWYEHNVSAMLQTSPEKEPE